MKTIVLMLGQRFGITQKHKIRPHEHRCPRCHLVRICVCDIAFELIGAVKIRLMFLGRQADQTEKKLRLVVLQPHNIVGLISGRACK